ncbi:hypothetical protein HW49_02505 [Porphyromonadaceae bacterium COT-184 OH4590]|nr:hypothetical protein HW49_02505 [Porphyromonadaceae bacterium COT-184 OH4590]
MKLTLSLGSNLGDKEDNIKEAIALIEKKIGSVVKTSSFYYTEPFGFVSENKFVNAIIEVKTNLAVYRVLKITQKIEKMMGRKQKSKSGIYHDRIIDIDIIFYSNKIINDSKLSIPHPRIKEREFVLNPLLELNPKYKILLNI